MVYTFVFACEKRSLLMTQLIHVYVIYCKIPKFSDARKLCYNMPKIQTKRPNLRVFRQKDANEIAKQ